MSIYLYIKIRHQIPHQQRLKSRLDLLKQLKERYNVVDPQIPLTPAERRQQSHYMVIFVALCLALGWIYDQFAAAAASVTISRFAAMAVILLITVGIRYRWQNPVLVSIAETIAALALTAHMGVMVWTTNLSGAHLAAALLSTLFVASFIRNRKHLIIYLSTSCAMMLGICLLYTSPSPRDLSTSRMPSSA